MKITELRIGDKVQHKRIKFPMTVTDIISDNSSPMNLNKGTVYVEEVDEEGDEIYLSIEDIEFCEPRYKLPEWKKNEDSDSIVSCVTTPFFTIEYVVDENMVGEFCLFFDWIVDCIVSDKRIGIYPTLAEAQESAEKHYSELASKLIEGLTSIENFNK